MTDSNSLSQQHRLSNFEIQERATEAAVLLQNPVLKQAFDDIYSRAEGILLEADIGSLTAGAAHATMKGIIAIRKQLEEYVSDYKVRQKYHKGDKDGG